MSNPFRTTRRRAAAGGIVIVTVIAAVVLLIIGFAVARAFDPPQEREDPDLAARVASTEEIAHRVATQLEEEADRIASLQSSMEQQTETLGVLVDRIEAMEQRTASRTDGSPPDAAAAEEFAGSEASTTGPPIAFEPSELDFGFVSVDQELTGTFQLRNVSERPVRIATMKSDCKCTTIEDLTGREIQPGESIEITAVVEPRSYPGSKESQIRFLLEDYRSLITYRIHSHVSRAVYTEPSYLNAIEESQGVVKVAARDGKPFRILAVNGDEPVYVGGFDPDADEPRDSYELQWDLSRFSPVTCLDEKGNEMPGWWVVETDHAEAPIVDLRVRHRCTYPEPPEGGRQWVLSELRVVLDEIAAGESAEFEVEMEWLRGHSPSDTIQRVESESPDMTAELVDVTREGEKITARVRVEPAEDSRGLLYGEVRCYGYQPGHSAVVTVIGRVVDPRERAQAGEEAGGA